MPCRIKSNVHQIHVKDHSFFHLSQSGVTGSNASKSYNAKTDKQKKCSFNNTSPQTHTILAISQQRKQMYFPSQEKYGITLPL